MSISRLKCMCHNLLSYICRPLNAISKYTRSHYQRSILTFDRPIHHQYTLTLQWRISYPISQNWNLIARVHSQLRIDSKVRHCSARNRQGHMSTTFWLETGKRYLENEQLRVKKDEESFISVFFRDVVPDRRPPSGLNGEITIIVHAPDLKARLEGKREMRGVD